MVAVTTTTQAGQRTEYQSDEQNSPIRIVKSDEGFISLAFLTAKGEQVLVSLTQAALLALTVPAN